MASCSLGSDLPPKKTPWNQCVGQSYETLEQSKGTTRRKGTVPSLVFQSTDSSKHPDRGAAEADNPKTPATVGVFPWLCWGCKGKVGAGTSDFSVSFPRTASKLAMRAAWSWWEVMRSA